MAFFHYFEPVWTQIAGFFTFDPSRLSDPGLIFRLGLQCLLLLGSAFFSGSETALFSLSRLNLQQLRRQHHPRSDLLHDLLDEPRRLIISILCGNELINIAATANMTGILVALYGSERAGWISVIVMVPLLLLFGEVTPKTIAVSNPLQMSTRVVSGPMGLWVRVIAPLRWLIRMIADRITTWIVGEARVAEHILRTGEFRTLIEEVEKEGMLSATDRVLVYNLLDASNTEIVEIMTPRTQTHFLDIEMSVEEMIDEVMKRRCLRMPVFQGNRDNIVGFVFAEDIIRLLCDEEDLSLVNTRDLIHPPTVVPLTKSVDEMLEFFQENDIRAAMVLNEFGGAEGIVTMEDVLGFTFSEIAGDMRRGGYHQEEGKNIFVVPGDMRLDEFNAITNFGLDDARMTTVAGVVFRYLDRLPVEGDVVELEGLTAVVMEMDGHRIDVLRIGKTESFGDEGDETEGEQDGAGHEGVIVSATSAETSNTEEGDD